MKKYLLAILISLISFNLYSQQLSIPETLKYINGKMYSNHIVAIGEKGEFFWIMLYNRTLWNNPLDYDKWVNKISNESNFHITTSDLEEIKSTKIIKADIRNLKFSSFKSGYNYISLECKKQECLKILDEKSHFKNNYEDIELVSNELDYAGNEKLLNALNYLQSLITNNEKYEIIDNDPFSLKNTNSSMNKENSILLKSENGVFKLTVFISSQPFEFILDSGASEVSISKETEMILKDKKVISNEDYIQPGLYQIADGTIIECKRVVLKNLQIGDIIIKNVIASVGAADTPLLLGRSFLDKFKSWKINNENNRLELNLK